MAVAVAHYRLVSPVGGAAEDGSANVRVADGTLVLAHQQVLLAELRGGRADDAAAAAGARGEAAVFSAMSGDEPVELRIHDDVLLARPAHPAAATHITDHESPDGSFAPALGGMMTDPSRPRSAA